MTRVLLIGGGSALQPRFRRIAEGIATAVICRASVLSWVHQLEENETVIVLKDDASTDAWLAAAEKLDEAWPVDVVASFAEIDQDKAAAIAEHLGLPFHSPDTVRGAHDKLAMREMLSSAGIESLAFRQVADLAALREFHAQVGSPLVLKPTRGRASAGISVIRSQDDLEVAFARTAGARAPRLEESLPLAERYVEGPEFSVETLTHRGVHYVFAVTEKFKDERTKVELGHAVPARLGSDDAGSIIEHVRRCLDVLGVAQGITHSEVILGPSGPVLVETHLRQAGDEIVELVEAATGVDVTELLLRQLAGEDIGALPELVSRRSGPHYRAAGAIRYCAADVAGRLDGVLGLDEVADLDGVDSVQQLVADGDEVTDLMSSYSRVASIRVHAPDSDKALALVGDAVDRVRLRLTVPA